MRRLLIFAALFLSALPASAQVTRTYTSGFEEGTTTGIWNASASPSVSTSNPRSGTYSLLINANGENVSKFFATNVSSGTVCTRTSFYVATTQAATCNILTFANSSGTTTQSITMDTSRVLTLVNDVTAASQVGPTLTAATHYWLEVCVDISNTVGNVRWRVDGSVQTPISSVDTLTTDIGRIRYGTTTAAGLTPFAFHYDDIAIQTGDAWFTTWATGAGGIDHIKPDGDVSILWTPTSGTNASNVDDTPGTIDDDTTIVSHTVLNESDRLSLTAMAAGVPADAVLHYASVGGRVGGNGTTSVRSMIFKIWNEGGTLTNGPTTNLNDQTTWHAGGPYAGHTIELALTGKTKANIASYDAGYQITAGSTVFAKLSALWVNIEWTNAPSGVARRRVVTSPP